MWLPFLSFLSHPKRTCLNGSLSNREEARAKLDDLISQEAPFEKEFKEYTSLFNDHDVGPSN